MLGTRTKQVHAYGKRGRRVVNVSEERGPLKSISTVGFDPPSVWRHAKPTPSPSQSPRVFTVHNRSSPAGRSGENALYGRTPKANKHRTAITSRKGASVIDLCTPPTRRPLSVVHPNVPRSLVAASTHKSKTHLVGKGTPRVVAPNKPHSPIVDVQIDVLDETGRRVSTERRVSRTDVQVNPIREARLKRARGRVIVLDDSGDEAAVASARRSPQRATDSERSEADEGDSLHAQPKPRKRRAAAKPIVISSDDEFESDRDDTSFTVPTPEKKADTIIPRAKRKEQVPKPLSRRPSPSKSRLGSSHTAGRGRSPKRAVHIRTPQRSSAHCTPVDDTQFQQVDLPLHTIRPRQLTPYRRRAPFPNRIQVSPPSSTASDDELDDLSHQFDEATLYAEHHVAEDHPAFLKPILEECVQGAPHEFSAFIDAFPFDPIVYCSSASEAPRPIPQFRKIGEASYSEVFGIGEVVLKVVPLRDEEAALDNLSAHATQTEGPSPSDAADVLKEIIVTKAMGDLCPGGGFTRLLRSYVVRGRYPQLLLGLWDEYNERKGSEGVRPDTFNVSQTYAIIVLPNGGPDLEAYTFDAPSKTGWGQACSLFWQVARALAEAEELVEFEHRDLHWGQILVKNVVAPPPRPARTKPKKAWVSMDDSVHGVKATLIDFGLSRMNAGGPDGIRWTAFEEEIFEGTGEYQFDVYRMMKESIGKDWQAYNPLTNVMWLHYLATKLLTGKRLRARKAPAASGAPAIGFSEKECYDSLLEVEQTLQTCFAHLKKASGGSKGRKRAAVTRKENSARSLTSAQDVVKFGVQRGWIK